MSGKIAGQEQQSETLLCGTRMAEEGQAILSDVSHALCGEYELLLSGQRYRAPLWTSHTQRSL